MVAIGVIVGRRNNIVHACDFDPLSLSPATLTDADAINAASTIDNTVHAIDPFC